VWELIEELRNRPAAAQRGATSREHWASWGKDLEPDIRLSGEGLDNPATVPPSEGDARLAP